MKRILALTCILTLLLGCGKSEDPNDTIRIMTYNVDAVSAEYFTPTVQDSLISIIERLHPEIFCFQELSIASHLLIHERLEKIFYEGKAKNGSNETRLYLYSRFPVRNSRRYEAEWNIDSSDKNGNMLPVMSVEIGIAPEKWVTLFTGHLRSSAYSTALRSLDEESSWLSGLKLYWRNYRTGKLIRDNEAAGIRKQIDEIWGGPIIVAGDLNDWNGSRCLKTLQGPRDRRLSDAWKKRGKGLGITYHGYHLKLRLDHVLCSDDFEVVSANVMKCGFSDHWPLVVDLRLKN